MENLTVCLANDSFPPTIDGVANAVVNYAEIINRDLGKSIVVTPYYPNVQDNYNYPVIRYPSIDLSKVTGYRAGYPFDIEALSQLNKMNIDIIHSHCPISSTFMARTLRESIHKPIVLTYHSRFDLEVQGMIKSKLIQDEVINALVDNISSLDEIWTVSKGAGESLKQMGFKGEYIIMPNGVDIEKGKSSKKDIDDFKINNNIPKNVPVYLYVGRMRWNKGLDTILDALKETYDNGLDFRMIFVGKGIDLENVKNYANKLGLGTKCIFLGSIYDRNELKIVYSSADIFLFPSEIDTNGIVVREAAATSLGTILLNNTCAAEDTTDKHNVIQIDHNFQALASELIRAGNNMEYFHKIGDNAQNDLYLSWEDAVDNAYRRYLEVIKKYEYIQKPLNLLDVPSNVIKFYSDFSLSVNKIEERREEIKQQREQTNEIISNTINDFITQTDENIKKIVSTSKQNRQIRQKERQQIIQKRKQAIKDEIDEIFERYL